MMDGFLFVTALVVLLALALSLMPAIWYHGHSTGWRAGLKYQQHLVNQAYESRRQADIARLAVEADRLNVFEELEAARKEASRLADENAVLMAEKSMQLTLIQEHRSAFLSAKSKLDAVRKAME